ncbi:MAG: family hydrolase [Cryobacterium sp.]|jgi:HAD superfamily hydrolase (TIGR01509 family)|nr:family hydrolase [Cryobacterium sp.]
MTDQAPNRAAVLFDIDGTLIDSNYLHVEAWGRTFDALGVPVDTWRIHRAIGMDGSKLLPALVGEDDAKRLKPDAKRLHSAYLAETVSRLRPFRRARELLRTLAARDVQVVLATSAPQEELERLLVALDCEDAVAHVTSAEDVESAKPDPDIITVALAKAGVPAGHAVMVGDAVWDIEACARAGVRCVAVLTGGTGTRELEEAGAVAIYDDVAGILAGLDESPLAELWRT